MDILCTICNDLLNSADIIFATKCGHVFHQLCLMQWIERSKTCPQCRNKVTDKYMFRLYLTRFNEDKSDDAATLQSRLDDAQLRLREQKALLSEKNTQLAANEVELKKNAAQLKTFEKKLVSRDSAVAALKDQLEYVKAENKELRKLKEENEDLKKSNQTLNGLQRVLNAITDEVEVMLQGYSDLKTVVIFATALKRALCESESKKNECRDRLQTLKQQLKVERKTVTDLQTKLRFVEEQIQRLKYVSEENENKKRDSVEAFGDVAPEVVHAKVQRIEEPGNTTLPSNNDSLTKSLVTAIETSNSPYLKLKQCNQALATLLQRHQANVPDISTKPSEVVLNSTKNTINKQSTQLKKFDTFNLQNLSIFHAKEPNKADLGKHVKVPSDVTYDGFGGQSKPHVFPASHTKQTPKTFKPKLAAKHKLRRPNTVQDISKMLKKIKDDIQTMNQ